MANEITIPPFPLRFSDSAIGYNMSMMISVRKSSVAVECSFDKMFDGYFGAVFDICFDAAKAAIDLVAFSAGTAVMLTFDTFVDIDGETKPTRSGIPGLAALCTQQMDGQSYAALIKIATNELAIYMAMSDLILSLYLPHHGIMNCARAVEGIRHLIAGPDMEPKRAWPLMREALNLDQTYIKFITDASMAHRHGHRVWFGPEAHGEVARRAWTIMDRFLHFRRRNNVKLPLEKFPLLQG